MPPTTAQPGRNQRPLARGVRVLAVTVALVGASSSEAATPAPWSDVMLLARGSPTGLAFTRDVDGRLASSVTLGSVGAPAVLTDGTVLVPDSIGHRVVAVVPDGTMRRVAGTGRAGSAGDGGPADRAHVGFPTAVVALPDGGYLIAQAVGRIRKVSPAGLITTVAGGGTSTAEGEAATRAALEMPTALAVEPDGSILVGGGARVRRIDAQGVIRTVAGTGEYGASGHNGSATLAKIGNPVSMLPRRDGSFLLADTLNWRLTRVDPQGTITSFLETYALGPFSAVTVVDNDDLLVAAPHTTQVYRLTPTGSRSIVLDRPSFGDFARRSWFLPNPEVGWSAMSVTPDGGLVFNASSGLAYAAPPQPARVAVRLREALVSGASPTIAVRATQAGIATVTIRRGQRSRTTRPRRIPAGMSPVPIGRTNPSGVYTVNVRLKAAGGIGGDRLKLFLGRWLPVRLAHDLFKRVDARTGWRLTCQRASPRRVICTQRSRRVWPGCIRAVIEAGQDGLIRSGQNRCGRRIAGRGPLPYP